jgi:hypothetical protein
LKYSTDEFKSICLDKGEEYVFFKAATGFAPVGWYRIKKIEEDLQMVSDAN